MKISTFFVAATALALPQSANAEFASSLVASSNVTAFGSGSVTGAPDGGGLFLGSTFDPPQQLGTFTVMFANPLGNGAGTDLRIYEIASSSNETFNVELSSDNLTYTLIGEYSATNNLIDWDGLFSGAVSYVRLTNTSRSVSADIDALEGFYNFQGGVPEPATWAMLILGMGVIGGAMRRRAARSVTTRASLAFA
jgi:hypothetical protein